VFDKLFVAQGDEGVDCGGAARGEDARGNTCQRNERD
jgi:hypothetical protein